MASTHSECENVSKDIEQERVKNEELCTPDLVKLEDLENLKCETEDFELLADEDKKPFKKFTDIAVTKENLQDCSDDRTHTDAREFKTEDEIVIKDEDTETDEEEASEDMSNQDRTDFRSRHQHNSVEAVETTSRGRKTAENESSGSIEGKSFRKFPSTTLEESRSTMHDDVIKDTEGH
ncbi:hypothetical protein JTB14_009632 [Gonioctena quinquepunctata]|nr:hypothetical protein JTB14_009632 [Gonioctena quinquepunctata]